jgi:hypothetical protein
VVETVIAEKTQESLATFTPQATATPQPTFTSTVAPILPTNTPKQAATAVPLPCNWAQYVEDVTVEDGEVFNPGETFNKVWRLKNIGTCTWTTDYNLVYVEGDRMGGAKAVPLTHNVKPGQTIDVGVFLTAPDAKGDYQGFWMLRDDDGYRFGIGANYDIAFWVEIRVKGGAVSYTTPFDFADNYCLAEWTNAHDPVPCPGNTNSDAGFAVYVAKPYLEKNYKEDEPAIYVYPEIVKNGIITGEFPEITIQDGDHFKAVIGCMADSEDCKVTFKLEYSADGGSITSLGSWTETYDGAKTTIDLDLSSLKDQDVAFFFTVSAAGQPIDDNAFWLSPRIE